MVVLVLVAMMGVVMGVIVPVIAGLSGHQYIELHGADVCRTTREARMS
jgi:hypothetical protein